MRPASCRRERPRSWRGAWNVPQPTKQGRFTRRLRRRQLIVLMTVIALVLAGVGAEVPRLVGRGAHHGHSSPPLAGTAGLPGAPAADADVSHERAAAQPKSRQDQLASDRERAAKGTPRDGR